MFETDSSAEFFGLSNDPNRKAQGLDLGGKSAYGFNASLEDFSGSASGQQLGSSLMDDPWLGDMMSSNDPSVINPRDSIEKMLSGRDLITGDDQESSSKVVNGVTLIQGGLTTVAEINEVNNLLANARYDRDQLTGDRHYTNNCTFNGTSPTSSANESYLFDRGDAMYNAIDVGEVVYRSGVEIDGWAGYTYQNVTDKNDYYKFSVGKAGKVDISLSGLSQNIGVALYGAGGNLITWSDKSGSQDESILRNLGKGDYYTRVYTYSAQPWNHGQTSYELNISRKADALESSWKNLIVDKSVENAALNSIKYDNTLSRDDVIGIIKSAGDFSVSGQELTNLRSFYHDAINTAVTNDAAVKVLSKKVLFSETSNKWYTGSDSIRDSLGNLASGSSTTDLNLLLGKHFLGTDRPAISRNDSGTLLGSYNLAGGTLFKGGVQANDVSQGSVGDCYYLAALAGLANDKSHYVTNMFTDNGDGTWSVRFKNTNGITDYVTVDSQLPQTSWGSYLYGKDKQHNGSVAGNNELWVSLAEKAYAQVNESGRIGQDGTNSYGGIAGGSRGKAIKHVSGLGYKSEKAADNIFGWWGVNRNEMISLVNSNRVVTIGSFDSTATNTTTSVFNVNSAVQKHAYAVRGYDSASQRFDIYNPWGDRHLSMTWGQVKSLGGSIHYTTS